MIQSNREAVQETHQRKFPEFVHYSLIDLIFGKIFHTSVSQCISGKAQVVGSLHTKR
jgi:hypothetical protein